jgi:hypothetical protein
VTNRAFSTTTTTTPSHDAAAAPKPKQTATERKQAELKAERAKKQDAVDAAAVDAIQGIATTSGRTGFTRREGLEMSIVEGARPVQRQPSNSH